VGFVFGLDAMPNLYKIVESLPKKAWKRLQRRAPYEVKTKARERPKNIKEQIVEEREFDNIRLVGESVAEFSYRPGNCRKGRKRGHSSFLRKAECPLSGSAII
jgi:hypothetical protein